MDYIVTIYSDRMYNLESNIKDVIDKTSYSFNRARLSAYNLAFLKECDPISYALKYGDKSIYNIIKDKYKMDTYHTNSAVNEGVGAFKSQIELNKLYKKQKEEEIKAVEAKLKEETKKLEKYIILRDNLIIYRQELKKNGKVRKLKTGFPNISCNSYTITVRTFKNKKQRSCKASAFISKEYGIYSFEYNYLNPKIKYLKSKISKLTYRLNNTKTKLKNLDKIKHIHFNKKSKYNSYLISGRSDGAYRNFVFKSTPYEKDNYFYFDIDTSFPGGFSYTFKDILFKYRGKELYEALKHKYPIAIGFIKKKDGEGRNYYQFKVTFNLGETSNLNTNKSNGIVGMDFNYGFLAISDVDSKGNMVNNFTVPYEITSNSKQNTLNLRYALNKIGEYVKRKGKTLVIEDLDTSKSKMKSTYRDSKLNKVFHTFPYEKYMEISKYTGIKYGFDVIFVSPKYTSIIGLLKYSYKMKLNSHIAASFVIARRGLSIQEKVPFCYKHLIPEDIKYKHNWAKWNKLNSINKFNIKELQKKDKKNKEYKNYKNTVTLYNGNEKTHYLTKEDVKERMLYSYAIKKEKEKQEKLDKILLF